MADCPSYYALGSIAGSAPVVGAGAKLNAQRREIKKYTILDKLIWYRESLLLVRQWCMMGCVPGAAGTS